MAKSTRIDKESTISRVKYEEALVKGMIRCRCCKVNMTLTYSKKENKRYRYYICNNHLRGKDCGSVNRTVVAGEVLESRKK